MILDELKTENLKVSELKKGLKEQEEILAEKTEKINKLTKDKEELRNSNDEVNIFVK